LNTNLVEGKTVLTPALSSEEREITLAASLEILATGLAGQSAGNSDACAAGSFSWGRRLG
jgi:hypothetical protein